MATTINPAGDTNVTRRIRALVVPREHGAWGLLFIPLCTGIAAGLRSTSQVVPLLLFVLSTIALFWLRTPVESMLGSAPNSARTPHERRVALLASLVLGTFSVGCLGALMWGGRNLKLLFFGAIAAAAFFGQAVLRKLGRDTRMLSQLIGAIGLTATAPAAYYLATGLLNQDALTLWLANWLFAWNQIHFVQVRIRSAHAITRRDKLSRGKSFLVAQTLLLLALVTVCALRFLPLLMAVAFLPVLVRGTAWFVIRPSESLDVKKLGWSEMKHGVAFGIVLAIAFLLS